MKLVKKGINWINNHIYKSKLKGLYLHNYSKKVFALRSQILSKKEHSKGNKIKVAFFVQRAEVFNSSLPVFNKMINDDAFEVYLVALTRNRQSDINVINKEVDDNYNYAKTLSNNCQIINTFDAKSGEFVDLIKFDFDYIFINIPYEHQYPEKYSFKYLKQCGKLCYISYAFIFWDKPALFETSYNQNIVVNADLLFADSMNSYEYLTRALKKSEKKTNRRIVFNYGFPRFDLPNEEDKLRANSIMWIPRWTTNNKENVGSSFFMYKDHALEHIKKYEYDFIIRPHPLMFDNYLQKGLMSKEEIDNFKKTINDNKNAFLDDNSDYRISINKSNYMLADFSSIVSEFFVQDKPIIYLDKKNAFSKRYKYVYSTFYTAKSWNEIENILNELYKGNDPKKEQRQKAIELFKMREGHNASEKIIDELKNDYKNY